MTSTGIAGYCHWKPFWLVGLLKWLPGVGTLRPQPAHCDTTEHPKNLPPLLESVSGVYETEQLSRLSLCYIAQVSKGCRPRDFSLLLQSARLSR